MRLSTVVGVVLALLSLGVFFGCVAGPSGGSTWTVVTSKDGKVANSTTVVAVEATDLPRDSYDVTIKDGKLSWWVRIQNLEPLRKKFMGQFSVHTINPRGVAFVKFEGTVDGGKTDTFKQDNVVVEGLTKESVVLKINALLLPGAGCVTCTCATSCGGNKCKGVPANWDVIPLAVQPIKLELALAVKEIVIPAPDFDLEIIGIEINEKGGRKAFPTLVVKNNEGVSVDITVRIDWSFDTGEKVGHTPLSVILQGNEKRLVDVAPVRTKQPFREINGKVTLVEKKYVKP